MGEGYSIDGDTIVINRDLTALDLFVRDFIKAFDHDYLIVSGFVSIATGRTRGTEDIDMLVPLMPEEEFKDIFNRLIDQGFWCYQGDSSDEAYDYIKSLNSIRFARKDEMFPNMEFIPINESKKSQWFEYKHPQKIRIKDWEFKIPPIEFEILYKEIVLGSDKDLEDAMHLRHFFSKILKDENFSKYELVINQR